MSEIACRKCLECGLISDVTQDTCVCGADLKSLPQIIVDLDELPSDQIGVISKNSAISGESQEMNGLSDFLEDFSDLEEIGEENSAPERNIILTAVRYGVHSFTITNEMVKDAPYMLGRAAGQSDFLSKDERVSNNHCTIFSNNGVWYVQDNSSTNGTFINDEDLGDGGCTTLEDGDRLKLGHSVDSMEFKVSFE